MRTRVPMVVAVLSVLVSVANGNAGTSAEHPRESRESARAALYPKVSNFLDEIAALEPVVLAPELQFPTRGSLPGWRDAVCPQLSGLSELERDLILARVSEIGRTAGVRMAGGPCRPNLHIFVTDQPKELLRRLEHQDSFAMFGPRGRPYLVDQLIAAPRAVRVWYNIFDGEPTVSFAYAFTRVLVIVDQRQLQAVSPRQLADYIAMVGFAEIKPGARLGDAPSILSLFDPAPRAAPAGLSAWDQAFLSSLYSNSGSRPWRRALAESDQLTLSMLKQIAP